MEDRNWSELSEDLLEHIAKRLFCIEDFLRFRMVCPLWKSVTVHKHCFQPLLSKGIPWLMLSDKENEDADDEDDTIRGFHSLSADKLYNLYLPEARGKWCSGTPYGWLITLGLDLEFHLLNPLTRSQIQLPGYSSCLKPQLVANHREELRRIFIKKAVLGLLPSSSTSYEDQFIVLALHCNGRLAFARPSDEECTTINTPVHFTDVTCFNGQIYAVRQSRCASERVSIFACDIGSSHPEANVLVHAPKGKDTDNNYYLLEMGGELHLVVRRYIGQEGTMYWKCEDMPVSQHFVIYKLDLRTREFSEVKSFEDQAMFVGNNSSFAISTADNQQVKGNCVYFTDDHPTIVHQLYLHQTFGSLGAIVHCRARLFIKHHFLFNLIR